MQIDRLFVGPPSRDVLLEISRNKNTQPLPAIKSHNGMRLPADRYSLVAPNFKLISNLSNTKNRSDQQGKESIISSKTAQARSSLSSSSTLVSTSANSFPKISIANNATVNLTQSPNTQHDSQTQSASLMQPKNSNPIITGMTNGDNLNAKRKLDD